MAGRRRDLELDERILGAAHDLLHLYGYRAFGIAELANHVGVARTTIYDRWPTKAALLDHVLSRLVPVTDQQPASAEDLPARLTELLAQDIELAATPEGRAIAQVLLSDQDADGGEAEALRARLEGRRQLYRNLLLGHGAPPARTERVVDLALSLVWGRAVLLGSLPLASADELASMVLSMLRAPEA